MRIIGSGYDGDLNLTSVTVEEDGREYRFERPRWISVEERLPESVKWVLCWYTDIDGDRWHTVGRMLSDGSWEVDVYDIDELEYYTVTHWMPLPEPPKEQ